MKQSVLCLLFIFYLGLAGCSYLYEPTPPKYSNISELEAPIKLGPRQANWEVFQGDIPSDLHEFRGLLVIFITGDCGQNCSHMEHIARLIMEWSDLSMRLVRVNVSYGMPGKLAEKFGVQVVPSLVFMRQGKIKIRIEGPENEQTVMTLLRETAAY